MKIIKERLAAIAEDNTFLNANQNAGSSFVEPELGRRAARRFVDAVKAGSVEPTDAWPLVSQHMHHWNPNEDPRLRGFINELASIAAGAMK